MNVRLKQFFNSQVLIIVLRLTLGVIFIAASIGKISDPDAFVSLMAGYHILPEGLAQAFGMVLPWVEFIVGSLLILGIFTKLASAVGIVLTASFIVANSCSLLCGAEGSCGCFGQAMPLSHTQSLFLDGGVFLPVLPPSLSPPLAS